MPKLQIEEKPVRLQPWVIGLLISVLLGMLSAVFTAGVTYNTVQDLKERVLQLERRLDSLEDRYQRGLR